MYECDSSLQFDDSNLPDDSCEKLSNKLSLCLSNVVIGWAVGSQQVRFF